MVAPVKLVMDIYAKKGINYLNNIVYCKFDNLYIYCNYCKLCNYHNLYIYHNKCYYKLCHQFDHDNQLLHLYNLHKMYKFHILYTKYSYYSSRNFDKD